MKLLVGRKEILVFLLALLVFLSGWAYPLLLKQRSLNKVKESLQADDFEDAEKTLEEFLSRNPTDRDAWLLSAVVSRRTDKESEFKRALENATKYQALPIEVEFQRKLFATQRGEIEKQSELALLQDAERFSSDFVAGQTFEAIARGYLTTYRLTEAWGCIDHWLKWQPTSLSAHFMRAEIILRTQDAAGVIEPYREILKLDPNSKIAQEKLAVNLMAVNEVDEAATILRKLAKLLDSELTLSEQWSLIPVRSNKPQVWIELAEAERRLGNIEAANEAISKAIEMGINANQRARVSAIRGQVQLVEQKTEQAVGNFLVANELDPADIPTHHALGTAFEFLGKKELATRHRESAQKIRKSMDEVSRLTQQVITSPNNPDIRMKIGQEFLKLGMASEGVGWIKTALECDANYEPARRFLSSLPTNREKSNGPE